MDTVRQIRFIWKPLIFIASLVPFALVVGDLFQVTGSLGANPVEEIQDRFGYWGLRFILIALAVTPARTITDKQWLTRFRRMLGLFAFFYVLMHFLTWLILDQGLLLSAIGEDIFKRPFITIGFAAMLILLALTATSTTGVRRRLGKTWQKLHNWVYAAAILGVWHYWWQVKLDATDPAIYAAILALLLSYRFWQRRKRARQRTQTASA
ncbi:MAG: sulfoxide reductase heme-binding subunit YedZ [Woeseia sp.]|jgi:methionine sulfoxide reductase heme-binding subunit|nr:sulfoxide reductase heme-binding subunit YedZ [Woeseia sp.]MBT6211589.1 sulfoxide reductase heme-binding subunit YedZ [Woeseia sp.]